VAALRHHQQVGHADWVIDIAIGTCPGTPTPPQAGSLIVMGTPVLIQIAIELKSIWTEHRKARWNRLRDFNAFHGHARQYHPTTVAAAYLVVNSATQFWSPLRQPNDITVHGSRKQTARELAEETVDLFRSIHLRNSSTDPPGLEALGVTVIEHDNLMKNPNAAAYAGLHRTTIVAPTPPSLRLGDPLHYETMIQRICSAYTQRFP
jgi:hypothetical protein